MRALAIAVLFLSGLTQGLALSTPTQVAAAGTHTTTIQIRAHDGSHTLVTSVPVGSPLHARVTVFADLKEDPVPTGQVRVSYYADATCSTLMVSQVGNLVGGSRDPEGEFVTPATVGFVGIKVTYDGDAVFAGATSSCRTVTVTKGLPAVRSEVHRDPHVPVTTVVLGTSVHVAVDVDGAGAAPTGVVRVTQYADGTCADPRQLNDLQLGRDGVRDPSYIEVPPEPGSRSYRALYLGDDNYLQAPGACLRLNVEKVEPVFREDAISTTLNEPLPDASLFSALERVRHVASLTSLLDEVDGPIRFDFFAASTTCAGTPTGSVTKALQEEIAYHDWPAWGAPATVAFRATYLGSNQFASLQGACLRLKIRWPVSSVSVETHAAGEHSSDRSYRVGEAIHAKVTVAVDHVAPSGTLAGLVFANGTCSGEPAQTFSGTAASTKDPAFTWNAGLPGSWSVRVDYKGDASYLPKSSACWSYAVTPADPTGELAAHDARHASVTGVPAGSAVHAVVAIAGSAGPATGNITVTFHTDGTCSGPGSGSVTAALAGGSADVTSLTRTLGEGSFGFRVVYTGDRSYVGATWCVSVLGLAPDETPPPPTEQPTLAPPSDEPTLAPGMSAAPGAPSIDPALPPGGPIDPAASPGPDGLPPGGSFGTSGPAESASQSGPGGAGAPVAGSSGGPIAGGPTSTPGTEGSLPWLLLGLVVVAAIVGGVVAFGARARRARGLIGSEG